MSLDTFGFGGLSIDLPFTNLNQLRPIKESEVLHPSRMLSLGDSTIVPPEPDGPAAMGLVIAPWFWHLAAAKFATNLQPNDKPLTPQDKAMLQRHGEKWSQVFCDGHVESGGLEKFFDFRNDEVLRLWNRDNEPHRDRMTLR